jgi:hypothetical protein
MYLKTFQYFVLKNISNINLHLNVSYLLENTLNNVHLLVLKLLAWKYGMVIGLHVAIREFGQCTWYYFYAIWYLTTICVHGLNLVQFGISILIFLIPICYEWCDQGLNWFSWYFKDIKLCTKFFILTIILFITTHKTHWEILNLIFNMKRKNN